ncbi:MAG TPA: hypothetical protein VFB74_04495 [Kribbellaceae bacterium]|nr:hypothetical protein [Kribbellaceae bacterium]
MPLTPEQRTQRARLAALARWSREDPVPNAERGQRGLQNKFLLEIQREFPDLPEVELLRRADVRFREHMQRLAFNRSKSGPSTEGGAAA